MLGFLLFAVSYWLLSFVNNIGLYAVAFLLYGLYYACTDGISKAFVANTCAAADKGKALGTFSMTQSILYLVASIITGVVWKIDNGKTALLISMCIAIISAVLVFLLLAALCVY